MYTGFLHNVKDQSSLPQGPIVVPDALEHRKHQCIESLVGSCVELSIDDKGMT